MSARAPSPVARSVHNRSRSKSRSRSRSRSKSRSKSKSRSHSKSPSKTRKAKKSVHWTSPNIRLVDPNTLHYSNTRHSKHYPTRIEKKQLTEGEKIQKMSNMNKLITSRHNLWQTSRNRAKTKANALRFKVERNELNNSNNARPFTERQSGPIAAYTPQAAVYMPSENRYTAQIRPAHSMYSSNYVRPVEETQSNNNNNPNNYYTEYNAR